MTTNRIATADRVTTNRTTTDQPVSLRTAQPLNTRCSKCGYSFRTDITRICPHPAVQNVYGSTNRSASNRTDKIASNKIASICYYCCKGCKHKTTETLSAALGCGYAAEI